jgi:uncharacterized protein YbaA (DUF1428 family)
METRMAYVDGFLIAVPTAKKETYVQLAGMVDQLFIDHGAVRVWECWSDDVPHGKLTDFYRSVQAQDDEAVVLSWIEWPDKATRDAAMAKVHDIMKSDDRFDPEKNPPPFDGKRMIFGGFCPVVALEK